GRIHWHSRDPYFQPRKPKMQQPKLTDGKTNFSLIMKMPENTADVDSKTENVLPLTDDPIPTGISAVEGIRPGNRYSSLTQVGPSLCKLNSPERSTMPGFCHCSRSNCVSHSSRVLLSISHGVFISMTAIS